MNHCAGCVCEVKNEGVEDPMGEYALDLEAAYERLRAALVTVATYPLLDGGQGHLYVVGYACRLCGAEHEIESGIAHTDECVLSSANDPTNYPTRFPNFTSNEAARTPDPPAP